MRVLLQRVSKASVTVEGEVVGRIEQGFVALGAATVCSRHAAVVNGSYLGGSARWPMRCADTDPINTRSPVGPGPGRREPVAR
jgi:hypothetical protein